MTTKELFCLAGGLAGLHRAHVRKPRPRNSPDGQDWAYEGKLEGYRCLAGKNGGVTLWSRRARVSGDKWHLLKLAIE